MTQEEFDKLPFRMVNHLSKKDEYAATYVNDKYGIIVCKHATLKDEFTFGRTRTHYIYKGVIYKSRKRLLEEIKNI